jgi:hypothetical protein
LPCYGNACLWSSVYGAKAHLIIATLARRGGWAVSLDTLLFQRRRWSPIKRHSSNFQFVVLHRAWSCRTVKVQLTDHKRCWRGAKPKRLSRNRRVNILQRIRFRSADHVCPKTTIEIGIAGSPLRTFLVPAHVRSGNGRRRIDRAKSLCDFEFRLFRRAGSAKLTSWPKRQYFSVFFSRPEKCRPCKATGQAVVPSICRLLGDDHNRRLAGRKARLRILAMRRRAQTSRS